MRAQWSLPPVPTHFDHHIDLHHQWLLQRNPLWLERGVFQRLLTLRRQRVELAVRRLLQRAQLLLAEVASRRRLRHRPTGAGYRASARTQHRTSSTSIADIRVALPPGRFDNVVWDFAFPLVQYFEPGADRWRPPADSHEPRARRRVVPGYTLATQTEGEAVHAERYDIPVAWRIYVNHMLPHFRHVVVFETAVFGPSQLLFLGIRRQRSPMTPDWPHARGL